MDGPEAMNYNTRILSICPHCGFVNDFRARCLRRRVDSKVCKHFKYLSLCGRSAVRVVYEEGK